MPIAVAGHGWLRPRQQEGVSNVVMSYRSMSAISRHHPSAQYHVIINHRLGRATEACNRRHFKCASNPHVGEAVARRRGKMLCWRNIEQNQRKLGEK